MRFAPRLPLTLATAAIAVKSAAIDQKPLSLDNLETVHHEIELKILEALDTFSDPITALIHLKPELEEELHQPRLLHIAGAEKPEWLSEGDKLQLRKDGLKFMDLTVHHDSGIFDQEDEPAKANLPPLDSQRWVKGCLDDVNTERMYDVIKHMTSYHDRYYQSVHGEESQRWLHDHIAEIIADSPIRSYISLEYHTHVFNQPSIVARFEPPIRNASLPLTIIGAHADSANYLFPLLPAPGADDDMSGSVTILEAFNVLASKGFIPQDGPVEFHWYAAEEAGLLGSQDIAAYKKGQHANVGAMIQFDMTAFVRRNTTEAVYLIIDDVNSNLTDWAIDLGKEYLDCPTKPAHMLANAGSDHMSWHRAGFPAIFATEGDPMHGGFPGDFDDYVHTTKDVMTIDNDRGEFSVEHMARFSKFAIAFAIEQAGWSKKHTRAGEDNGH